MKKFAVDPTLKLISITKNENESNEGIDDIFLETELQYKPMKTSTVVFIKKVPNINCKNISSIKKDLQVLNFSSEGNDNSIFQNMQNYIQNTFCPLFNSFSDKMTEKNESQNLRSNAIQTVKKNINELVILLSQAQKIRNRSKFKIKNRRNKK